MDVIERALNGDDINIVGEGGRTALISASMYGHSGIVKLLLDKGSDPNLKDSYGRTALMFAASMNGHSGIVKLLFDKGADINIVNIYGQTALISASMNGRIEIVRILLDKGSDPNIVNSYGETAITLATDSGHIDIVKLIKGKIYLQNALQNLALSKCMNSLSSPLQFLDYDIMKEIMICKREYNHGVQMRMK
jgi:ankyrin repeat protein